MRSKIIPQAPKLKPLIWVLKNKLKVSLGRPIPFDRYIDYTRVKPTPHIQRISFLDSRQKAKLGARARYM